MTKHMKTSKLKMSWSISKKRKHRKMTPFERGEKEWAKRMSKEICAEVDHVIIADLLKKFTKKKTEEKLNALIKKETV
jgi:hypothetical protein